MLILIRDNLASCQDCDRVGRGRTCFSVPQFASSCDLFIEPDAAGYIPRRIVTGVIVLHAPGAGQGENPPAKIPSNASRCFHGIGLQGDPDDIAANLTNYIKGCHAEPFEIVTSPISRSLYDKPSTPQNDWL
jgi:hypothetical protein